MKKLFLIFLIFLTAGRYNSVCAQVVPTAKLCPLIQAEVTKELLNKGYSDNEVSVLNIPIQSVTLPEGTVSVKVYENAQNLTSREYRKVDILVNNKHQRSIGVPVSIKVYQEVLVAKSSIAKDGVLSEANVEKKRSEVLGLTQNAVDSKMLSSGIIATRAYRPGELIDRRFSKTKPDVVKNALVTVIFKTDNEMAITVDGVALVEGNIGGFISVQNRTYNKVYLGKVIGTNKVLVEI